MGGSVGSFIRWRDGQKHPEVVTGVRNLPKKPVIWWGSAVIFLRDDSRIESDWRSRGPITVVQAKDAIRAVARDMIADLTNPDDAIDSGFVMHCR